ncbi:MAG: transcription factor [Planctomycetes bacterium]|nr:transcription factor [Planctomycetota bacterium]
MKTRRIQHEDGRTEIVRVLSTEDLIAWSDEDPLAYEKSIVWLEDIGDLDYVRVVRVNCAKSRRGPLSLNSGERVVGYAKLMPDAPRDTKTQRFARRLFYLRDVDGPDTEVSIPETAVDPRSVLPGIFGEAPVSHQR